jgi:hypothetical protein
MSNNEPLYFSPFISSNSFKDYSLLKETVLEFDSLKDIKSKGSPLFSVLRGSMVSNFNGSIEQQHRFSDFDLVHCSKKANRKVDQHKELVLTTKGEKLISVDHTHLNCKVLRNELLGLGEAGVTSMNDLVMDFLPITNESLCNEIRSASLFSFLRLGYSILDDKPHEITTSGAMKLIQQGRLFINPLRWWSIYFSYHLSNTSQENISHYSSDIEQMLETYQLKEVERFNGERRFVIPRDLELSLNPSNFKWKYYGEKLMGRLQSTPNISLNDFQKAWMKGKSFAIGYLKGYSDLDVLFSKV